MCDSLSSSDAPMLDESLAFLDALYEATRRGVVTWRMVPNEPCDLFEASVDGETVTIELLMLYELDSTTGERAFVRIVGLKTWEVFARGTAGYDTVLRMLSLNISGWSEGQAGAKKSLQRALARVRALLALLATAIVIAG